MQIGPQHILEKYKWRLWCFIMKLTNIWNGSVFPLVTTHFSVWKKIYFIVSLINNKSNLMFIRLDYLANVSNVPVYIKTSTFQNFLTKLISLLTFGIWIKSLAMKVNSRYVYNK